MLTIRTSLVSRDSSSIPLLGTTIYVVLFMTKPLDKAAQFYIIKFQQGAHAEVHQEGYTVTEPSI